MSEENKIQSSECFSGCLVPQGILSKSISAARLTPVKKRQIECPYCKDNAHELYDEYSEGTVDIVRAVICLNCEKKYAITYEIKEIHEMNNVKIAA